MPRTGCAGRCPHSSEADGIDRRVPRVGEGERVTVEQLMDVYQIDEEVSQPPPSTLVSWMMS
jgi:hypothetical protein